MDETQGIAPVAPASERKPPRPARPWIELLFCVFGSLGSLYFPSVGTAAMVFGAWLLARPEEGRAWLAVAGCLVPGIALSFVSWEFYGSLVLPCILCALAIALLLPRRLGVTGICLVVVGTTAAMILADVSLLALWGESLSAYVDMLLEEMRALTVESLGGDGTSAAVMASVDQTLELFGKIWPLIYALRAAGAVLLGLVALAVARRSSYQRAYAAFTRLDMPLWVVVALIAGVVCLGYAAFGMPGAQTVEAVGLNVLVFVRVLFFLQGLAVAMHLMDRRRWGSFARVCLLAVMLMAEMGLYAVCVFGVVDVWANFRKLPRQGAAANGDSHGEGE